LKLIAKILIACFFTVQVGYAQVKDANLWLNLGVKKLVNNTTIVSLSIGTRIANNMTWRNYQFVQLGINKKISPWLSVALSARVYQQTLLEYTRSKYRLMADVILKKKWGNIGISNRLRFQYDKSLIYNYESALLATSKFRDKVEFNFRKGSKLQPNVSAELWFDLRPIYKTFNNLRLKTGFDYQYDKHHCFSLSAIYDKPINQIDTYTVSYILGGSYLYTF
jgi:Protein of unknown function (DUF2490)